MMEQANAIFSVRYSCCWMISTMPSIAFVGLKRNFQMIAVSQAIIYAGRWLFTVAETMKALPASFNKPC